MWKGERPPRSPRRGLAPRRRSTLRAMTPVTGCVEDVDPVDLPVLAPLDELEILAGERMERVGYPDPLSISQIVGYGCIRRWCPTR